MGTACRAHTKCRAHTMKPVSKHIHLSFILVSFLWLLLTVFGALFITRFSLPQDYRDLLLPTFHPQGTILTIAPLIFMNFYWVRHPPKTTKHDRDFSSRRYLILFGLIAALMTGIAAQMEFLPFFFHQIFVWPLIIAMIWDFIKCLKTL